VFITNIIGIKLILILSSLIEALRSSLHTSMSVVIFLNVYEKRILLLQLFILSNSLLLLSLVPPVEGLSFFPGIANNLVTVT
jgi:hypothetical protein